jgi:hypothetical protein
LNAVATAEPDGYTPVPKGLAPTKQTQCHDCRGQPPSRHDATGAVPAFFLFTMSNTHPSWPEVGPRRISCPPKLRRRRANAPPSPTVAWRFAAGPFSRALRSVFVRWVERSLAIANLIATPLMGFACAQPILLPEGSGAPRGRWCGTPHPGAPPFPPRPTASECARKKRGSTGTPCEVLLRPSFPSPANGGRKRGDRAPSRRSTAADATSGPCLAACCRSRLPSSVCPKDALA